jgi:hypothetical protein
MEVIKKVRERQFLPTIKPPERRLSIENFNQKVYFQELAKQKQETSLNLEAYSLTKIHHTLGPRFLEPLEEC